VKWSEVKWRKEGRKKGARGWCERLNSLMNPEPW
jgi:hypothetical protein